MLLSFVAPPRLRSPRQNPPARPASRSSSRDELSCGQSRSLQPGPPSRCPPYPPPPLLPSPELSMAEITITQRPAHVRHGSNIGQPLKRQRFPLTPSRTRSGSSYASPSQRKRRIRSSVHNHA